MKATPGQSPAQSPLKISSQLLSSTQAAQSPWSRGLWGRSLTRSGRLFIIRQTFDTPTKRTFTWILDGVSGKTLTVVGSALTLPPEQLHGDRWFGVLPDRIASTSVPFVYDVRRQSLLYGIDRSRQLQLARARLAQVLGPLP